MTTTPTPSTNDKLRAGVSLWRAAELIGRACAAHHGHPEKAPPDPLDGLPPHCCADVGRALGTVLDYQLGVEEALQRLMAIDASDLYAVADLVAETAGWDGWIALRTYRLARRYHRDIVDIANLAEVSDPPRRTRWTDERRKDDESC